MILCNDGDRDPGFTVGNGFGDFQAKTGMFPYFRCDAANDEKVQFFRYTVG